MTQDCLVINGSIDHAITKNLDQVKIIQQFASIKGQK